MTAHGFVRGWSVEYYGATWRFTDTGAAAGGDCDRPCAACDKRPIPVTVLQATGPETVLVDACLAPLIRRLNASCPAPVTRSCCCGHGRQPAEIVMADGTIWTRHGSLEQCVEEVTRHVAAGAGAVRRIIADWPPTDGDEWECQCARCGSSTDDGEICESCGGEGYDGSACPDDMCHGQEECIHGDRDMLRCDWCRGHGYFPPRCLSPADWCEAHPMAGREDTPRGAVEWFTLPAAPSRGTPE